MQILWDSTAILYNSWYLTFQKRKFDWLIDNSVMRPLQFITFKVNCCNLRPELVEFVDGLPVNEQPPLSYVLHTTELMFQVVCVFPDVNHKQRIEPH